MPHGRRHPPGRLELLFRWLIRVIKVFPVTLSCIALQVIIYLLLSLLRWNDSCISAYNVWKMKDFVRLLFGAFAHGNFLHLWCNIMFFLMKGQLLEEVYRSKKFLYVLSAFTILTSAVQGALIVMANEFLNYEECAAGFTGVSFALTVWLTRHIRPIFKFAVWTTELLFFGILMPEVSSLGNLAGVLVGVAYVSGPLKYYMDAIYTKITGGRSGSGIGWFNQLFRMIRIENIPPVTLVTIGLQVALYHRLLKLPWHEPSQVCISMWKNKDFNWLLYGALEHSDDLHLYYNMFSFALKGQFLEKRLGSKKFLCIVSVFPVVTSVVLVALNGLASQFVDYDEKCIIGFTGVLFALKVLITPHVNTSHKNVYLLVRICAESLLIKFLVPHASLIEHLAGVLVGIAYIYNN